LIREPASAGRNPTRIRVRVYDIAAASANAACRRQPSSLLELADESDQNHPENSLPSINIFQ
jgi:hypothetical protein